MFKGKSGKNPNCSGQKHAVVDIWECTGDLTQLGDDAYMNWYPWDLCQHRCCHTPLPRSSYSWHFHLSQDRLGPPGEFLEAPECGTIGCMNEQSLIQYKCELKREDLSLFSYIRTETRRNRILPSWATIAFLILTLLWTHDLPSPFYLVKYSVLEPQSAEPPPPQENAKV